jgi:hypothetical protein
MIACGSCSSGKACSDNECVTTTTTCSPDTCSGLFLECGAWNNGCGGTINCGSCDGTDLCELGLCVSPADVENEDDVVDDTDNEIDGNIDDGEVIVDDEVVTPTTLDFNKVLFKLGTFDVTLWMLLVAIALVILLLVMIK